MAPGIAGTSRLSPHLHFGEISPGQIWRAAGASQAYLRQIVWREFAYHLLFHFPESTHTPLRAEFAGFPWRSDRESFLAWKRGKTGYPLVDAGMCELWHTGWMHNRVRMIVASFLTKDLLLDYRLGERHFEQRLADADLAANNGGWQWSASTGTDAAPYFRVFNPVLQSRKFDPDGVYLRTWLPELSKLDAHGIHEPWTVAPLELEAAGVRLGRDYPQPLVDHFAARERALAAFGPVLGKTARSVKS